MPREPFWIDEAVAIAVHDRQTAEHGGLPGLRDQVGLGSALARSRNRWEYGERSLYALAAAYAFGIVRNHPFADGNKRTAWVMARLFLALNWIVLKFSAEGAVRAVMQLASGVLDEDDFASWLDNNGQPKD